MLNFPKNPITVFSHRNPKIPNHKQKTPSISQLSAKTSQQHPLFEQSSFNDHKLM